MWHKLLYGLEQAMKDTDIMMKKISLLAQFSAIGLILSSCAGLDVPQESSVSVKASVPANSFDLSHWKITLPTDENNDGKVDTLSVKEVQAYFHPDFFYLNEAGGMVFTAPNKGALTENTSNTRSELRYMLSGEDKMISSHDNANNFAVRDHKNSHEFGAIGGRMDATLQVNHVAENTNHPEKKGAYSTVIGQIHAVKFKDRAKGLPYGNEPLKIFYKKWPHHETGSVFWTYERNLAKKDRNRTDIVYPVWGHTWKNTAPPGDSGVALGEDFSYTVNVHENTMHLTFESPTKDTVTYAINLANNIDAYGKVDTLDNVNGYKVDSLYFKAGAYNQCSTVNDDKPGQVACHGTGNWHVDKANGDYAQATFSKLIVRASTAP